MADIAKLKKKKTIYLIAMIIIALLLVGDLAVFFIVGNKASRNNPFGSGNMPGNFPSDFSGEFSTENMPEGFNPGSKPEGFDSSSMPEGFNPGSMPGGSDSSDSEDGSFNRMPGGQKSSFILPIVCGVVALILVIAEIIFIVLYVKLSKKVKKFKDGDDDDNSGSSSSSEIIDPVELRKRKQKKDRITLGAVLAVVLVIVVVLATLSRDVSNSQSVAVDESVLNKSVDMGTINKTIKGSGVIAATAENDVTIAGNITVTNYYVSEGDVVSAGDIIASVDMNSVKAAIGEIESMMEDIDEEMMSVKDKSVSDSVTAPVDGRVVKIYASDDDEVVDVMYENGALLVLSLDGLLAVDIANDDELSNDTSVIVTDEDGNDHKGIVTSVEKEKVTIKVSMDDFSFGENVIIKSEDGTELDKGALYVSNELKITGYSGTIDNVNVSENESVDAGDKLITLENTDYTATYKTLLSKRAELEEKYNELEKVASTGYIKASSDGTVSGIDSSLVVESLEASAEAATDENTEAKTSVNTPVEIKTATSAKRTSTLKAEGTADAAVETTTRTVSIIWLDGSSQVTDQNLPELVTVQLYYGETLIDTIYLNATTGWDFTWTGLQKYNEAGEIPYTINLVAVDGYTTTSKVNGTVTTFINTVAQAVAPDAGNMPSGDASSDSNVPSADTPSDSNVPSADTPSDSNIPGGDVPNDSNMPSGDTSGDGNMPSGDASNNGNMPSSDSIPSGNNMPSGGNVPSGYNSDATTDSTIQMPVEEEDAYAISETVICQLTPNDEVSISVTIDELDINKVSVGQECDVILDALTGQSFTGTIIRRDASGENNGGNTKYTVIVNVEKTESMLLGMNASVSIPLEKKENILIVPEEALVEQDGHVYVYTGYNEKKDELTGMTEVTTGTSDGINAEITEGLEAGQTVYYRYAGTILYTF